MRGRQSCSYKFVTSSLVERHDVVGAFLDDVHENRRRWHGPVSALTLTTIRVPSRKPES